MVQTDVPNTHGIVSDLSKSALDFAEATANFGALKVIFGVFMVVVIFGIIMMINSFYIQNKRNIETHETMLKVKNYFDKMGDREIGSDEANFLIRRALTSDGVFVKYSIVRVRLENNLVNKTATEIKVKRLIDNLYNDLDNFLSQFICGGQVLSDVLDHQDVEAIRSLVMEQVYRPADEFTISSMDQTVDIFFSGLKSMYIKKLRV